MDTVERVTDIRKIAADRPAKLILRPHTEGEIVSDAGLNITEVTFEAPVDILWNPCSDAAARIGFDQERRSTQFPYEFFRTIELSTVVAYACSKPFEYNKDGSDPISAAINKINSMDTELWLVYASFDIYGNVEYRLGGGKRVLKQKDLWVYVDDSLIDAFFRDIADLLTQGGEIILEDFVGPGGFKNEEHVYNVLDNAGLVLTAFELITSPYQTSSAVIAENLRSGRFGKAGRFVIKKVRDDDDDGNAPVFKPDPSDPVYA